MVTYSAPTMQSQMRKKIAQNHFFFIFVAVFRITPLPN